MRSAMGMAVIALWLVGLGVLDAGVCCGAQDNSPKPPDTKAGPVSDKVRAKEMLVAACTDDPRLHGAWVWLEPDDLVSSQLQAKVLVDSARAGEQLKLIQELIARLPLSPTPRVVTPVHELPITRLVAVLQAQAVKLVGRRGCYVRGAYYRLPTDRAIADLELVPYGRGVSPLLRDKVIDTFVAFLGDDLNSLKKATGYQVAPASDRLLRQPRMSEERRKNYDWLDRMLATDSRLRGVRVDLEECPDQQGQLAQYDVYTYVDTARAAEQGRVLKQLLDARLAGKYQIVEAAEWPVSLLVTRLNLQIEARPGLDGCVVLGAYFAADYEGGERQPKLVLDGRVAREDEEQRESITSLGETLIKLDPAWETPVPDFAMQTQAMQALKPSIERGRMLFSEGYEMFWQGRYEAAREAFNQATLEDPEALSYRYWRILSEIQFGRTAEAYQHMVAVLQRNPSPTARRLVLHSLNRIQGPLRGELRKLEHQACLDIDLFQNRVLPNTVRQPAERQAQTPPVLPQDREGRIARSEPPSGTALGPQANRSPAPVGRKSSLPTSRLPAPTVPALSHERHPGTLPLQTVVLQTR